LACLSLSCVLCAHLQTPDRTTNTPVATFSYDHRQRTFAKASIVFSVGDRQPTTTSLGLVFAPSLPEPVPNSNQCILQRQDIKIHAKISDNGLWFISGTSTSNQVNAVTRLQALEKLQKANNCQNIPAHHDDIQNINDMHPLQLHHYRFGHVNFKYIEQYIKHHNQKVTITGMECETCSLSQGRRQPVAKEST
jgi:hypothetical protein